MHCCASKNDETKNDGADAKNAKQEDVHKEQNHGGCCGGNPWMMVVVIILFAIFWILTRRI